MIFESLKLLLAAGLGFLTNFLLQRNIQKRVKLEHELRFPAVFSAIPPKVAFQDLRISNVGNSPATKIKVIFKKAIIDSGVLLRVSNDEKYNREESGEVVSLIFERLLPKEDIVISFKSLEPLPSGFLVGIKSNEVISHVTASGSNKFNIWFQLITIIIMGGMTLFIIFNPLISTYLLPKPKVIIQPLPEKQPIVLSLMFDKQFYSHGDSVVIEYSAYNSGSEILSDITVELTAHGFPLSYDQEYYHKNFLEIGDKLNWKVKLRISDEVPPGSYPISLETRGYYKTKRLSAQVDTSFIVK